jgi:hypothetical protein
LQADTHTEGLQKAAVDTDNVFSRRIITGCLSEVNHMLAAHNRKHTNIQWGEQLFEVCHFDHRYTSTVRDGI